MTTILETFQITELTVSVKDPQAGMFDTAAYHAETLYFKNGKLAKAYAQAKYPGCNYKTQKLTAVPDETTGLWSILDYTDRVFSIGQTLVRGGEYYQFSDDLQGCLPISGNWMIGLTAVPAKLTWLQERRLFRRDIYNSAEGFMLEHAHTIKDITHILCACAPIGILNFAKARPQPVALVSHAEIVSLMSDVRKAEKQVISKMNEIQRRDCRNIQWLDLNHKRANLSGIWSDLQNAENKRKKKAYDIFDVSTDPKPRLK